ncbi:MAG: S8 family serine peptidase [Methylacidiphilales bacterium]|nr:S8 family serine peptidase [Candidatus Methylacidiphilales bacterium]MDW8349618.1 S8 family serine peptidase [Verrucomicrobiae bacterium]
MHKAFRVNPRFALICGLAILGVLLLKTLYKPNPKKPYSPARTSHGDPELALNFEGLINSIDQEASQKTSRATPQGQRYETQLPRGAIPNQRVLRFATDEELEQFREIADRYGLKTIGVISAYRAIAVEFENLYQFGNVLEQAPEPLGIDFNYRISIPPFSNAENKSFNPADYQSFHNNLVDWLGLNLSQASRNVPIIIALLDTPIRPHSAIPAGRVISMPPPKSDLLNQPETAASGHGTAIASILVGNHPLVPGIAPQSIIHSIPVLGNDGYGDSFTLAQGIQMALQSGARIINLSLGSAGDSSLLREAIADALARKVFVVAAAGNQGQPRVAFPAAYPGVLSVGAVDAAGKHLPFSNTGYDLVLTAPGWGINAAWKDEAFVRFSGTSAAAPVVSGAIVHLLNKFPSLTPQSLIQMLQTYSDDSGAPGYDPIYGHGMINIMRLLNQDIPNLRDVAIVSHHVPDEVGDLIPVQISVQNRGTRSESNIYVDVNMSWLPTQRLYFPMLGIGQTASQTLFIPRRDLEQRGQIELTSTVNMPQWSGGKKQTLQTLITRDQFKQP